MADRCGAARDIILAVLLRDIVGHRRLTALIARAIERDSLPPTLLFAGPSGVGKWAVAQATAQVTNCLERQRFATDAVVDACGSCRACDRIMRGVHVDVITVEPDEGQFTLDLTGPHGTREFVAALLEM